jgi:hypothetical protein
MALAAAKSLRFDRGAGNDAKVIVFAVDKRKRANFKTSPR